MLETDFRQAAVAGVPDAGAVEGLVDRGFHACSQGVFMLPGPGFLLGAGGGDGLVQFAGPQGKRAAAPAGGGALLLEPAGPADAFAEGDDDGVAVVLLDRVPVGAGATGWASDLPGLPVDGERGLVEAFA